MMQDLNDLYYFVQVVAKFLAAYPEIQIHLESANRRVDVIAEGFDIAIRVRFPPLERTDLVMRRLDMSTQCLVASPSFTEGRTIVSPADLDRLPSITFDPVRRDYQWQFEHVDGQTASIVHAVFPSRRGLLPSVRTLLDFLAMECAEARKRAFMWRKPE